MIDLGEFRDVYFEECGDLLGLLEAQLNLLRSGGASKIVIDEAFRAIHSIKGGAGALRLTRIVEFSHRFETFFDLARSGALQLDGKNIDIAFAAADMLADLVGEEKQPGGLAPGTEEDVSADLDRAIGQVPGQDGTMVASHDTSSAQLPETGATGLKHYRISFTPAPDVMRCGTEPLFLFRELRSLGELDVEADTGSVPAFGEIDPLDLHIKWKLHLKSSADRDEIAEVFEFVAGENSVTITTVEANWEASPLPDQSPPSAISSHDGPKPPSDADVSSTAPRIAGSDIGSATIRVDLERVDKLVNLVGQIAISQTLVSEHLDEQLANTHPGLVEEIEQLQQYTQALQDGVMAIRALPVGLIFTRLPKLVREISRLTGKSVRLETRGEETEIDKTVIEQLYDPLMHMIRNAIGHGIELPEDRIAAGKPVEGQITVSAWQSGSKIVICLEDDGAGIDRDRVRAKAISNGMISPDDDLSVEELDRLIMTAGFSTAEEISEVSGRGVGMDVVCQNIHRLGGQVTIQSEPGRGTAITMALPLTLAVMEGMAVRVAAERYVIPITSIIQSTPLSSDLIRTIPGEGEVMRFRNDYVKLIRLENVLGIPVREEQAHRLVVLVEIEDSAVAVVVDEIIGQLQVVTKTLEQNYQPVPGIAAATIMGDGEVALILDPSAIASMRPTKTVIAAAPLDAGENVEVHAI